MNLTLKPELESFIQQEILAGKYSSPDEAIEAALNLLQSQNSVERLATELRDKIDIAVAKLDSAKPTLRERGEGLNSDDVIASLRRNIIEKNEDRINSHPHVGKRLNLAKLTQGCQLKIDRLQLQSRSGKI